MSNKKTTQTIFSSTNMKHGEATMHKIIPTKIILIVNSISHTKTKIKETIGIINKLKETIEIINKPKAIFGITRVKEKPGTTTHKPKTVRLNRIKTMEGDFKEHVLSVEREDRKQKTVGIIQKYTSKTRMVE